LPVYLVRFIVLLQGALFSSLLTIAERIRYRRKVREVVIERAPVFIIGHWRTGSTFLHQLLHLDPSMVAPNLLQTVIPDHFLFSSRYYLPLLKRVTPPKRPMDNVRLGPLEPQEEEFALLRMGAASPLEYVLFPRREAYFLKGYSEYVPAGKKRQQWEGHLTEFYRKLTFETGRRIVSKNPCHTMRLKVLADMFPGARFIHIVRDPLKVVPSTKKMWDTVARENALKRGWKSPGLEEVAEVLKLFLQHVETEKTYLEKGRFAEVRFEDLERQPLESLKQVYDELGLVNSPAFESAVKEHLKGISNYEKNTHRLTAAEESMILNVMRERLPSP